MVWLGRLSSESHQACSTPPDNDNDEPEAAPMPSPSGRIDLSAWMPPAVKVHAPISGSAGSRAACVKSTPPMKKQKLEVKEECEASAQIGVTDVKREETDDFGAVQEVVEQSELDEL